MLLDELLQFPASLISVAVDALADEFENLAGGLDADIGADQRVLEFLEQIRVDFFAARNGGLEVFGPGPLRVFSMPLFSRSSSVGSEGTEPNRV